MIEVNLTKKETVILISALKTAEFLNENGIDIIDKIIVEHLTEELNKKLITEILEKTETEKEKEDNLPF